MRHQVMGTYSKARITNAIIQEAQQRFAHIFGYTMAALTDSEGSVKGYVLMNSLTGEAATLRNQLLNWNEQAPDIALLMTCLSLILLSHNQIKRRMSTSAINDADGQVREYLMSRCCSGCCCCVGDLVRSLTKLGLEPGKDDGTLGSWEKTIDFFVQQMYVAVAISGTCCGCNSDSMC
jgi:hypothetical protein